MLREAQKLRYRVYCTELGRDSPAADHTQQTIADELDAFGHCFVAVRDSDVIGTIRVNFSREGPLGILEGLYGMAGSDRHPATTAISTKFVIDRAYRGGLTAMRLIAQLAQYGDHQGIEECYGDAIPSLIDYYQAMGFEITGEAFFHRENGPSVPIRLDLTRHIEAMSSEAGVRRMLRAYVKSMREAAAAKAVTDAGQQPGETS
jgi:GNAT superfamily N-acetyltransferase